MKVRLKTLTLSLIIAGIIILLIGCYYADLKAGIPYQDPPHELQIQYAVNSRIGDELINKGVIIIIIGLISNFITGKTLNN